MKKLGIALASLIAVVVVLAAIAPKDFKIEREIVINRPKDAVFAELKLLKHRDVWNPWMGKDPQIVREFKGVDGTVGAVSVWKGNSEVGSGEEEIKSIVEGERIESELRFKEPMDSVGVSYLTTESMPDGQTKVKWGMTGTGKFPFNIICLFMNMDNQMGKDFEAGLQKMKVELEK